jgi:hypothetical protein
MLKKGAREFEPPQKIKYESHTANNRQFTAFRRNLPQFVTKSPKIATIFLQHRLVTHYQPPLPPPLLSATALQKKHQR